MHRINATLLEKLFISPAPLSGDKKVLEIYNFLRERMFPGEQSFIDYLSAQNSDSQFALAETIIHRLCFESNYPPSFFAIKDIVTVEEYQKRKISEYDPYIPRDHFLHIVNLYLLGIYIFFYNTEFHDRIIRDNRFQRSIVYGGQYRIDCYKDFISEWKYFCLYHDIGYVPEMFANELLIDEPQNVYNEINDEQNDFCDSLGENQIIKQMAFFGSIEVLSRILAWRFIVSASRTHCNGEDKMFRFFKQSDIYSSSSDKVTIDFDKECKPVLNNLTVLDRIYSNACLKPLLPIIGDNNLILVGLDRNTGEIGFLSLVDDKQRKLYYTQSFKNQNEYNQYIKNPTMILFDDFAPNEYELVYLCDIDKSEAQFPLSNLFNSLLIDKVLKYYIDKGFETSFASAANEEQLLQFYYDIYIDLFQTYKSCTPFIPSNKLSQYPDIHNLLYSIDDIFKWREAEPKEQEKERFAWGNNLSVPIQKYVLQDYSQELANVCLNELNKTCKSNSNKTGYKNLRRCITSYLNTYSKKVEEIIENKYRKRSLVDTIVAHEKDKLETKEALLTLYSHGFYMFYHIFSSVISSERLYKYNYKERKSYVDISFCKEHIPQKIGNEEITIEELMEKYIKSLTKNNSKCKKKIRQAKTLLNERMAFSEYRSRCDHGFESVKYAGSVFNLLQSAIVEAKGPEQKAMIDILFSLSQSNKREDIISHCVNDYEHVFNNVIYAIMIHNIWPKTLGMNLNTTIVSEPFAYFALMCDSLQQWNRPQGLSHSLTDIRPYKAASEEYDIIVEDNQILIYEAKTDEMQTRLKKTIDSMNDFLKDIKALVKIGYSTK